MTMIGICGDNCLYCPRYVATRSGGAEELEKVKDLWIRLGLIEHGLPAGEMICSGCVPENNCAYSGLRACVYGKGIENCGLCETYPCELVNGAFDKSEGLRSRAAFVCTTEEMEVLQKAFFSKRENLDQRHFEKYEKKSP